MGLYFLPMAKLLNLPELSEHDAKLALFWLGTAMLFQQLELLLQGAYRCIARYSYGSFLKSGLSLAAFGVQLAPVVMEP